MVTRRLLSSDAPGFVALRVASLRNEPLAFSSSIVDDHGGSLEVARKALAGAAEEAVYGYFQGAEMLGIAGVLRAAKAKHRHKAELWGMYVTPEARGRGVGRALLDAVIAHAREWDGVLQLELGVTSAAPAAQRLFERAGFHTWGREPRALQHDGLFVDEFHMSLEFETPAASDLS